MIPVKDGTDAYFKLVLEPLDTEPVKSTMACENAITEKTEYSSSGQFDVRQGDISLDSSSRKDRSVSASRRRQAMASGAATGTGITGSIALPSRKADVKDAVHETSIDDVRKESNVAVQPHKTEGDIDN